MSLAELLIVLAILGILTLVLLPNLLHARILADERAAQHYSAAVHTALTATLATDPSLTPGAVAGGGFNCGPGAAETLSIVVAGTAYPYGWYRAPRAVVTCVVSADAATGAVDVAITTATATFLNGTPQ